MPSLQISATLTYAILSIFSTAKPLPLTTDLIKCYPLYPGIAPLDASSCIALFTKFTTDNPEEAYTLVHHPPTRPDELECPHMLANRTCGVRIDFSAPSPPPHHQHHPPTRWELMIGLEAAAMSVFLRCRGMSGGRVVMHAGVPLPVAPTTIEVASLGSRGDVTGVFGNVSRLEVDRSF